MSSLLASRLSSLYDHPETKPAWPEVDCLVNWIYEQYNKIPCQVVYVDYELTLDQCRSWHQRYGVLMISAANNSPVNLTPAINLKFRAVHDWHHITAGADSTLSGEIQTFKTARRSAPKRIHWLLFSEIVLQAAACIHHGEFQPQRTVKIAGF